MTTQELIDKLRELDPSGERTVVVYDFEKPVEPEPRLFGERTLIL